MKKKLDEIEVTRSEHFFSIHFFVFIEFMVTENLREI